MKDWLSYTTRNPGHLLIDLIERNPAEVTKIAREQREMHRAMRAHRKLFPLCYVTGLDKIAVHHIVPVSIDVTLAADPTNFISLHPKIHLYLAHVGYYKNYTENIVEVCDYLRENMVIKVTQPRKIEKVFGFDLGRSAA